VTGSSPEPVTVVIPVHDRAALVGEAIASALAQTGPAVEVVVVDDGSTDGSGDVVATLAATDRRVRLVRQANAGPAAARNRALAEVRTRLVTFLDSDDLMCPARLERQVARLGADPPADLVIGVERIEVVDGVPVPRWVAGLPPPDVAPRYYTMSMLIDRAWIDRVGGFDESIRVGEDVDLLVRLRAAGARMATIDDVVVVRRVHGDNLIYAEDDVDASLARALRRHLRSRPGSPLSGTDR
jgi:glycosyltransferase involved in cell wall biosynthesis